MYCTMLLVGTLYNRHDFAIDKYSPGTVNWQTTLIIYRFANKLTETNIKKIKIKIEEFTAHFVVLESRLFFGY